MKSHLIVGLAMACVLLWGHQGGTSPPEPKESKLFKKGDTLLVTDSSGNVVRGVIQEASEGGRRLSLVKVQRYTLEQRIRAISTNSKIIVTLKDGTPIMAPFAEANGARFAVWIPADESALRADQRSRVKKWIAYEDVYSVFDRGKVSLGRGAPVEAFVVSVDESRQVERLRRGSGGKGALIGFAVGAGLSALASAGCCGNPDVGPAQAFALMLPLFGGAGAGVGFLVGRSGAGSSELLFRERPLESQRTMSVVPILGRDRWGIALSLRF